MALRVGLTGGIGGGKSTVAGIFEVLGIPVYNADEAARLLMTTDPALKSSIKKHFGEQSYLDDQVNRVYLGSTVFNNSEKLQLLNSIVHPATILHASNWMTRQQAPYTVKEAALLFEAGSAEGLDFIIGVFAPQELRVQRVMARDHTTAEEVMKRINRQMEDSAKMKLCHFVITNDGIQPILPRVLQIHHHLLEVNNQKAK